MKLQSKLHLMISLVVITVVVSMFFVINVNSKDSMEKQMEIATSDMAYNIAIREDIAFYLSEKRTNDEIQNLLLPLMKNTHYYYIIVLDMDAIQYSYPYESGLYKLYKNGGEEAVLDEGASYTSADTNELISAIRAFQPIFYGDEQVGAVLVGLLTDTIQSENLEVRRRTEYALVISVLFGVLVAYLLTLNIKKSIFNLEPKEIALLLTQKEMIFNNLELGVIAVDEELNIILNNPKADQILCLDNPIIGLPLEELSKNILIYCQEAVQKRENLINESTSLNNGMKVMINICVLYNHLDDVLGAVISIEDLTMVRQLAEELTGSKVMVESLRAQNHEFMNKLQVLSGLIQLEKYNSAIDFIDEQTEKSNEVGVVIGVQIDDDLISGLILSKYEIIVEKKIDFVVDNNSALSGLPPGIRSDDVCTIIANLLDNSMEAVMDNEYKWIQLQIYSDSEKFELIISNNGPAIDDNEIFDKGYSTKGTTRGYGLSNIMKIISGFNGKLYYTNKEGVNWHVEK